MPAFFMCYVHYSLVRMYFIHILIRNLSLGKFFFYYNLKLNLISFKNRLRDKCFRQLKSHHKEIDPSKHDSHIQYNTAGFIGFRIPLLSLYIVLVLHA